MKIAVFVSGGGTNLKAIIQAIQNQELQNVEIATVIASRNCKALEYAIEQEIPTWVLEKKQNITVELEQILSNYEVDLIVLAGFLSILPQDFCKQWNRKIINLHPSLLPKYGGKEMYGMNVHKAVIANHEKESGATVHYVNEGIDTGEIIAQKKIKIKPKENVEWLAYKISQIEKPLLIQTIQMIQQNQDN